VLFILSRAANAHVRSDYLIREFDHAKAAGKLIIGQIEPVEPLELNPFFRVRQAIDISTFIANPRDDIGRAKFDVLLANIHRHIPPDEPDPNPDKNNIRTFGYLESMIYETSIPRTPRLLPYLSDRHQQNQRITNIIQRHLDAGLPNALTFLIVGREDQCVDSFIEQVEKITLPSLLVSNDLAPLTMPRDLRWPCSGPLSFSQIDDDYIDEYVQDLASQVRQMLGLKITDSDGAITQRIRSINRSFCLHLDTAVEEWKTGRVRKCEYWNDGYSGGDSLICRGSSILLF
jgi:inactive STAND